jgi:DNA-binding HxlR family transcriptional regulator
LSLSEPPLFEQRTRTAYAEVPPRVEYARTPPGAGPNGIMASLVDWAIAHHDEIRQNRVRSETAEAV